MLAGCLLLPKERKIRFSARCSVRLGKAARVIDNFGVRWALSEIVVGSFREGHEDITLIGNLANLIYRERTPLAAGQSLDDARTVHIHVQTVNAIILRRNTIGPSTRDRSGRLT